MTDQTENPRTSPSRQGGTESQNRGSTSHRRQSTRDERWTLANLLSDVAEVEPDRLALTAGDQDFSYGKLDRAVNCACDRMRELGVKAGDRVALFAGKSAADVVAVIAIARCGAIFVPIDAVQPVARIASLLKELQPSLVVAPPKELSTLPEWSRALHLDKLLEEGVPRVRHPVDAPLPEDVAYIIYTSGSTGSPKGVQIEHRQLRAFFEAEHAIMQLGPGDRFLNLSPFHFDLSILDVFFPLYHGARVFLSPEQFMPRAILRSLEKHRITHTTMPMSKLALLTRDGAFERVDLSSLRVMETGAEVVDPNVVNIWLARYPNLTAVNGYGPTEATCVCILNSMRGWPQSADEVACIGRPLAGTLVRLVDDKGAQVTEADRVGELWIGGVQIMRGYFARPEETAQAIVEVEGVRYYRTGDLCKRRSDGRLVFVGRRDSEVKIRGYRVHLNEVNKALVSVDGVEESFATTIEQTDGERRLVAALVLSAGATADGAAVIRAMRELLPAYMVPAGLLFCAEFPRLSNGKMDAQSVLQRLQQTWSSDSTLAVCHWGADDQL